VVGGVKDGSTEKAVVRVGVGVEFGDGDDVGFEVGRTVPVEVGWTKI
jgi:hypothetical protein